MEAISLLGTIVMLYISIAIVAFLHELGHVPKRIKFKLLPIPTAVAMQAKYRLGGLFVNIILFSAIFYYEPESILLQYVGFIAWAHFIIYSIVGSILPEKSVSSVNTKTYVFDDVPNEKGFFFIIAAIFSFILLKSYYLPIIMGAFN